MPPKTDWTEARDAQLRRFRAEGATWDVIAAALGVSRYTAIERGRRIGARKPPPEHKPAPEDPGREFVATRRSTDLGFAHGRHHPRRLAVSPAGFLALTRPSALSPDLLSQYRIASNDRSRCKGPTGLGAKARRELLALGQRRPDLSDCSAAR